MTFLRVGEGLCVGVALTGGSYADFANIFGAEAHRLLFM
jgi:hypothetical protein